MPELPEVEIIKLGLQKKIVGLRLTKIQLISPKTFIGNPNEGVGQKVLKVDRIAKMLLINLTGNKHIIFHLKMSGQLIWVDQKKRFIGGHPTQNMTGKLPNSHTRVIFSFSDGSHLYFNDQRRFGWIKVVTSTEVTSNKLFNNLGPEPLEKGFDWKILKTNLLKHKNMAVKVALMDPKVMVGVGNIYANEACFNAKIDPGTKVSQLTDKNMKSLHRGVLKTLRDGIKYGGSTKVHFVDPEGHKGYFLDYAFVYGRNKHPCKVCGTEIKKVTLGGRGTYLCPNCQKIVE